MICEIDADFSESSADHQSRLFTFTVRWDRIVAFPRLCDQILLIHTEADGAIATLARGFIRHITQVVLVAQFLLDLLVNFFDGLLLGNLEVAPASFLRYPPEYLFAVYVFLLRIPSAAATHAAAAPQPSATQAGSSKPASK